METEKKSGLEEEESSMEPKSGLEEEEPSVEENEFQKSGLEEEEPSVEENEFQKSGLEEEYLGEENEFDDEEEWSDEEGLVKLFGYENERYVYVPRYSGPPAGVSYDYDSDRSMTDEEYRVYSEQVKKSGGFDVGEFPTNMIGQILPMPVDDGNRYFDFDECSQHAIDDYNRRIKGGNRELEFVKVLKVMAQSANCIRGYITFEAKDLADGGKIKIYQAVVLMKVGWEIEVSSFRLKPPEDEQGACNHGEEWFWEDHLCHGRTG